MTVVDRETRRDTALASLHPFYVILAKPQLYLLLYPPVPLYLTTWNMQAERD